MESLSNKLRGKIFDYYLRNTRKKISIEGVESHPGSTLSSIEIKKFSRPVWMLTSSFYVVNKGIKFEIPKGFHVCFENELNILSKFLLGKKYPRPIIALVWFRDVLNYPLHELKHVVDCVMIEENIKLIPRFLILLSLQLTV